MLGALLTDVLRYRVHEQRHKVLGLDRSERIKALAVHKHDRSQSELFARDGGSAEVAERRIKDIVVVILHTDAGIVIDERLVARDHPRQIDRAVVGRGKERALAVVLHADRTDREAVEVEDRP